MSEIEIPKKDKVRAENKNWFRWTNRKWNADAPSALTHISTGVVYASPGVVKIPPCVLDTRPRLSDQRVRPRVPPRNAVEYDEEIRAIWKEGMNQMRILTDIPVFQCRNPRIPRPSTQGYHLQG